jgi:hypothetical protein
VKQFLFLFFSSLLISSSCKKNKAVDPLSQLPPEAQTGANTFGCLVNGVVFKPGGASLSGGSLQCNYQFVNGGYYFILIGRYRNNSNGNGSSVGLYTDSLKIQEGVKQILKTRISNSASASYSSYTPISAYKQFQTNGTSYTGELWIKKFDSINQIVAGTFSFTAINDDGDTVKITDGGFDTHYTR